MNRDKRDEEQERGGLGFAFAGRQMRTRSLHNGAGAGVEKNFVVSAKVTGKQKSREAQSRGCV